MLDEFVPLNNPFHVRFKVFTAVTMKNAVFWDVKLYGSCTLFLARRLLLL
jgi:hypothetical protein